MFNCKHCALKFKSSSGLWRHVKLDHKLIDDTICELKNKNKIYLCVTCCEKFTSKNYLGKHQKKCKKAVVNDIVLSNKEQITNELNILNVDDTKKNMQSIINNQKTDMKTNNGSINNGTLITQ